jgi:hypothetical protein
MEMLILADQADNQLPELVIKLKLQAALPLDSGQ